MKKIIVFFLLWTLVSQAHCQIVDFLSGAGGFVAPVSETTWKGGGFFEFAAIVHPEHDDYYDIHPAVRGSFSYNSVSIPHPEKWKRQFLHYQFGFGITNSEYFWLILNGGYFDNQSNNGNDVMTISISPIVRFPFEIGPLTFYLSGEAGLFFKSPYGEFNARQWARASLGVRYSINGESPVVNLLDK